MHSLHDLNSNDRLMVLAPHPDDETLGCGGIIQQALARNLPVRVVFLTYGDGNELSFTLYRRRPDIRPAQVRKMALVRRDEALEATARLGVPHDEVFFLGYPDFGNLRIWLHHWEKQRPYRGLLTRSTTVPYESAYRPHAPYKGESILSDIRDLVREAAPTRLFLSHPADHNQDHRALYLFTQIALWDLGLNARQYPYLVHWPAWPRPKGFKPEMPLEPPPELAGVEEWRHLALTPEQVSQKRVALDAHRTQLTYGARYLRSFVRRTELFGLPVPIVLEDQEQEIYSRRTDGPVGEAQGMEVAEEQTGQATRVEQEVIAVRNEVLWLNLRLTRPLRRGAQARAYLFTYRKDRPFEDMPKLQIRLGVLRRRIFDRGTRIDGDVVVEPDGRTVRIELPLDVLQQPEKLLIGSQTHVSDRLFSWTPWRICDIRGAVVSSE